MPTTPLFTHLLPSLHPSPSPNKPPTQLETRIYSSYKPRPPDTLPQGRGRRKKGERVVNLAVVAHPYAPLGGNFNDHVVRAMVGGVLEGGVVGDGDRNERGREKEDGKEEGVGEGWVVVTFNFRGAGRSTSRTTWSGDGEVSDYISIIGAILSLGKGIVEAHLQNPTHLPQHQTSSPATQPDEEEEEEEEEIAFNLLLAGYSYGSLILSHLPPLEEICRLIEVGATGGEGVDGVEGYKPALEMFQGAGRKIGLGLGLNPGQQEEEARRESKRGMKGERKIRIHPQYLLISPLLPPLANFLSLSVGLPSSITSTLENFTSSVSSFFRPRNDAPSPPPPPPLPPPPTKHNLLSLSDSPFTNPGPPTLIIHGTTDIFTPLHKYRVWKEKWLEPPQALQGPQTPQASQSRIGKRSRQVIEVPTAGHFWIEEGVRDMLVGEVRGWLGREGDGGDEDEGIEGVWVYL